MRIGDAWRDQVRETGHHDRPGDLDQVAGLIVDVLESTTPATTAAGAPGKAKYHLADGVADRTRAASAEMLDTHPLYPGLEL